MADRVINCGKVLILLQEEVGAVSTRRAVSSISVLLAVLSTVQNSRRHVGNRELRALEWWPETCYRMGSGMVALLPTSLQSTGALVRNVAETEGWSPDGQRLLFRRTMPWN
jgi:hypothetical protein